MKQQKTHKSTRMGQRLATGFLAFAMTLGWVPPVGVGAVTVVSETGEILESISNATLNTTLSSTPETLPPIEGTPSWDMSQNPEEDTVVEPSHWADPYMEKMLEYGYMTTAQATFPDEMLSRAEFMAVINRAYGYNEMGNKTFSDVLESDWYYEDVSIATNAGFISGTSDSTAEPLAEMTRETTAFILGKNLMLPEMVGENMVFTDTNEMSDWSRGMVKSASHYGLMTGYDDGSFRPNASITRGEIAALVLQAVGTPILTTGEVELNEVWGNVTITEPGTVLKNTIIAGDLHVSNGIGLGGVILENVTVLGRIVVTGGESEKGEASIILRNVVSSELIIDNMNNNSVSVRIDGTSYIQTTYARTNCYIEDNTTTDDGLRNIIIDAEPGVTVDLSGRIKEVNNISPNTNVRVVAGTVDLMNIDERATEVNTEILLNAAILDMNIDTATNVSGEGDLGKVTVNANDVVITMLPDDIVIRPGVQADINGQIMDSNTADSFASAPRILAGYPVAADIAPTSLVGVFATNKIGTLYWAVSSITQGSVSEDDLISPPSYGGNIVINGSVDVLVAEEELTVFIGDLNVGGQYYLSAVLVDSRGDVSPVKVTSFETPDNTVPAFAEGYPYMSLVTHNTAQVTVMATKTCKLYYAVLPAGSVAPTGEDFIAGAISGSEGSGVHDLEKNKDVSFTVSNSLLELKEYELYLWLTDADNMNSSEVEYLSFKTLDGTNPIWNQVPTTTTIGMTDVGFSFSLNEDGTVYWIAVVTGTVYPKVAAGDITGNTTEPWYTDYAKLQVAMGTGGGVGSVSGNMSAIGNETHEFNLSGLDTETSYDLYYVAKDLAGNYSDSIGMVTFNTLDSTPPEFVEQTFSHVASAGSSTEDLVAQPYASTNITLTFSEGIQSTPFEGSTGESFLTLYSAVTSASTSEAETTARNKLAAALYNSITLYTWNGNTPTAVVVRDATNENDPDVIAGDWVIDYRYATVTLYNGQMNIIFPTSSNITTSALNLSSGVTYGFKLHNIQDSSYDSNVMVPAEMTLEKFTTIFAEIALGPASVIGALPVKRAAWDNVEGLEPGTEMSGSYATLDADLRITPSNMTNVDKDVVYDIRFNPNTLVSFNVYYRLVDDKGDYNSSLNQFYPSMPNTSFWTTSPDVSASRLTALQYAWTPDANGWIMLSMDNVAAGLNTTPTTTPLQIQGDGAGMGIGFNYGFLGYQGSVTPYPTLSSLSEDYQIEMLFEVTSFEGSTTRGEWNGYLEIDTQIYAGSYSYVQDLGPSGSPSATVYQNLSLVSVPSDYAVTKNFTDSIPPAFSAGAPQAYPEDILADIKVSFDGTRTGTLYYAVVEGSSPQNMSPKDENGNNVLSIDVPDINSLYYSEFESWPLIPVPTLSTPIYLGITTYIDPDNDSMYGSMALDKTSKNISLSGLKPLTTYYVYFVTISDNGGGFSDPQLYKFTTTDTEKPKYQNVVVEDSSGNVTWTTHVASNLNYLMLTDSDASRFLPVITENFYEYLMNGDPEYSQVPNGSNTGDASLDNYTFVEVYQMSHYWLKNDRYYYGYWEADANGVLQWHDGTKDMDPDSPDYEEYVPYTILALLKLEYFETGGNYDHPDYTSSGYTGFDVFASDTLKAKLYEDIVNQSQSIVSKGSNTTEIDGATTAVRNPDTGNDPDFEYVLFITGKNVNANSNDPVAYTNTFYVKADFAVTDLKGPIIEYVTSSTEPVTNDVFGLPETYSGEISINFDKFLYAVSGSTTFFLQFGDEPPPESVWTGEIMKAEDLWRISPSAANMTLLPSYWSDIPSKVITVSFEDIKVGTSISFFNGQVFISNKNGVSHNPTTLTVTLRADDVVETIINGITGVTTTTTTRYYWWETNWDDDWASGSGVNHATANSSYISVDTGGYDLYLSDGANNGESLEKPIVITKNDAVRTTTVNVSPTLGTSTFSTAVETTDSRVATATATSAGVVSITNVGVGSCVLTVTHSSNQTMFIYVTVEVDPYEADTLAFANSTTQVSVESGDTTTVDFTFTPVDAFNDITVEGANSGVIGAAFVTSGTSDGTGTLTIGGAAGLENAGSGVVTLVSGKSGKVLGQIAVTVTAYVAPVMTLSSNTADITANRSDDDIDYTMVAKVGGSQSVTFSIPEGTLSGNNFTLSVEDSSVLGSTFSVNTTGSSKSVSFSGKKTGVTNVTVRDNVNDTEIVIQVVVGNVMTDLSTNPSTISSMFVGQTTEVFLLTSANNPEVNLSVTNNAFVNATLNTTNSLTYVTLEGARTTSIPQTITVTDSVSGLSTAILVGGVVG